jgi:hypothetical protein
LSGLLVYGADEWVTGDIPGPEKSKEAGYLKDVTTLTEGVELVGSIRWN